MVKIKTCKIENLREEVFYTCDPELNVECKKTHCAYTQSLGECKHTTNPAYAKGGIVDPPELHFGI